MPAGDPLRAAADDMRAHIQSELLALALTETTTGAPRPSPPGPATGMKCPKCGYLGFETTDRCRNCGYDFSLAAPLAAAELPLRMPPVEAPLEDLVLRRARRQPPASGVAHDRDAAGSAVRVRARRTDYRHCQRLGRSVSTPD